MFKNILLASDGSKHAQRAAEAAAELAAAYGARLTIVSVASLSLTVDDIERMPRARRFPKAVKEEIGNLRDVLKHAAMIGDAFHPSIPAPTSALLAVANDIIDQAETAVKKKKAKNVARVALTGDAAEQILDQAAKIKADVIVMGRRGLSDLRGLVMGSVSHKIMHLADCACLTVK